MNLWLKIHDCHLYLVKTQEYYYDTWHDHMWYGGAFENYLLDPRQHVKIYAQQSSSPVNQITNK